MPHVFETLADLEQAKILNDMFRIPKKSLSLMLSFEIGLFSDEE